MLLRTFPTDALLQAVEPLQQPGDVRPHISREPKSSNGILPVAQKSRLQRRHVEGSSDPMDSPPSDDHSPGGQDRFDISGPDFRPHQLPFPEGPYHALINTGPQHLYNARHQTLQLAEPRMPGVAPSEAPSLGPPGSSLVSPMSPSRRALVIHLLEQRQRYLQQAKDAQRTAATQHTDVSQHPRTGQSSPRTQTRVQSRVTTTETHTPQTSLNTAADPVTQAPIAPPGISRHRAPASQSREQESRQDRKPRTLQQIKRRIIYLRYRLNGLTRYQRDLPADVQASGPGSTRSRRRSSGTIQAELHQLEIQRDQLTGRPAVNARRPLRPDQLVAADRGRVMHPLRGNSVATLSFWRLAARSNRLWRRFRELGAFPREQQLHDQIRRELQWIPLEYAEVRARIRARTGRDPGPLEGRGGT